MEKDGVLYDSISSMSDNASENIAKVNANQSERTSAVPSNSKGKQSIDFFKPIYNNQAPRPQNKSYYHSPSAFMRSDLANYQSNGGAWNNKCRYKSQEHDSRNGEIEASTQMSRGPRFDRMKNFGTPTDVKYPEPDYVKRHKYNLQDFQVEYDDAKFYVIKSISEDDVHKSIKYNVWSSTPNGNRKLDAAFQEAENKTKETGKLCPVFLFFSVNGSGHFVGVAEMILPVDFTKDMDFWQLENWNGFFPLMWHIIKDVPNSAFQHIILENDEDKPVTRSRDTQEIGLRQGLEMLKIFKGYSERSSIIDDFGFCEHRGRALERNRRAKAASRNNSFRYGDHKAYSSGGGAEAF